MEALLKKRGLAKAAITRIENFVINNENNPDAELLEFIQRKQRLSEAFIKFEQIQDEIECLDDSDEQVEYREIMEEKYYKTFKQLQKIIDSQEAKKFQNVSQNSTGSNSNSHTKLNVKLPEIHIQTFSGKASEWISFYEIFTALIINNTQLSDNERFMYLKSYLKNEPLNLINNLQITSDNFRTALKTLEERYSNKISVINCHIKTLLEIPSLVKCNSQNLRDFITQIKQNTDSLKNLQVPVEHWDLLLIYFFEQKLDFNTRKTFETDKDPNVLPTLTQFLKWLERRCLVLENLSSTDTRSQNKFEKTKTAHHSNLKLNTTPNSSQSFAQCIYCKHRDHKIYRCIQFKALSHSEKENFIRSNKLCFNCLGTKHTVQDCTSQNCHFCSKKHHSILHLDTNRSQNFTQNSSQNNSRTYTRGQNNGPHIHTENVRSQNANSSQPAQSSGTHTQNTFQNNFQGPSRNPENEQTVSAFSTKNSEILLATAVVTLYSSSNEPIQAKVLLDGGSQTSFITEKLVSQLNYTPYTKNLQISGICEKTSVSNKMVNVMIHSTTEEYVNFNVSCAVLEKITCKLPQNTIKVKRLNIPDYIQLADPKFFIPSQIDMLIGADVYYDILSHGIVKLGKNLPILQNTCLGWIIAGKIPANVASHTSIHNYSQLENVSLLTHTTDLDHTLTKFWSLEEISNNPVLSPDDELCEKIFTNTTQILENGSYQVNLPFKTENEHLKLGESFSIARKRFLNLEKRFEKDPSLFSAYKQFIDEYVTLGHAKYVPLHLQNTKNENKYFLPHHCVIREHSKTTKIRVVFDASCKTTTGYSLNDTMLKGYQVQSDLYDILNRFRLYKFVIICDIEKMYRQVKTNPSQNFLQNILWRENKSEPLQCIELQTVTYGTNSAPYLATRTLKEVANNGKEKYPVAADAIQNQCYVDDILYGSDTYTNLVTVYDQLNNLLNSANFRLHKWCSNSRKFLENYCENREQNTYDIKLENASSKVLGVSWDPNTDNFSITLPQDTQENKYTKREVLSKLSQMFDPLGLIGPVIVIGKIIMQRIWLSKINWDEQLDSETLTEWKKFITEISYLAKLKVPRYLFSDKQILEIELHGFADASLKAYGACIYLRVVYTDNTVLCNLVSAKSRIAPIQTVSLPRLELCAMLLLANLTQKIISVYSNMLKFNSVNLWTDSEIALYWIKSHASRWTIFVSNRVSKIQHLTSEYQWRHVRSKQNPADLLSRGILPNEIIVSKLWWHGPDFLQKNDLDLRKFEFKVSVENPPEKRKVVLVTNVNLTSEFWENVFNKFSTFTHLQRTVAYCLRFIKNSKPHSEKILGALTVEELHESLTTIVKILQTSHFLKEISELQSDKPLSNKQIISLNPFLDKLGILRVGGRLAHADVPYSQKHPILLPSKNHVVTLLLRKEHLRLGHAGPQTVLSNFRLNFWPLDGLRHIKRIIRNCITCFRFKAQPSQQIMADLPKDRVSLARPFQKVGVDFGGPFFIKSSRLRKAPVVKGYIAVFVCMITKAIHIELVSSLSTEAFLLTLKRFISRRGNPTIIYSDNATNFLGSSNQLKELFDFFKNKQNINTIQDYLSLNEITWKFIPPRSPHWGGLWESAIKSAKHHLFRIVGNSQFTFEEFSTICAQVEAILNSRPLCALSNDPSDLSCLTPGHFLIGTSLTAYPEKDLTNIPENRLSVWKHCAQIQQIFWKRWKTEYLNRLQNRPKWLTPADNIKVNDLVLLKEDNTPPLKWPLARVTEVISSSDKKVRVVKLKTREGIFTRAVTKICPIPPNDSQNCV